MIHNRYTSITPTATKTALYTILVRFLTKNRTKKIFGTAIADYSHEVPTTNKYQNTTAKTNPKRRTIMTTKKALTGMMIAAAMLFGGSQSAQATVIMPGASTSGETKVQVNVPEFIILHYYSDLTLNFAAPTQAIDEEGKTLGDVAWSTGTYDGDIQLTQDAVEVNNNDEVLVNLNNLWAVRGFSGSGNAKISIDNSNADMKNEDNDNSIITMVDLKVTSNNESGTEIEVPLNGISKERATKGGVSMTLDFSETTTSGLHTGGLYKITAVTI
jgi:hypothetical protein